jgi:putative flippase GtrA
LNRAFARYLVTGGVNTGVTYALYLLLLKVLPYGQAYTLTYVLGIALAYALQVRFVFKVDASWRTFLRFPMVYLVQYLAGWLVLRVLVERGLMPEQYAMLVVIAVTVPLGFVLSRALLSRTNDGKTLQDR